jgi:hypothetical protein
MWYIYIYIFLFAKGSRQTTHCLLIHSPSICSSSNGSSLHAYKHARRQGPVAKVSETASLASYSHDHLSFFWTITMLVFAVLICNIRCVKEMKKFKLLHSSSTCLAFPSRPFVPPYLCVRTVAPTNPFLPHTHLEMGPTLDQIPIIIDQRWAWQHWACWVSASRNAIITSCLLLMESLAYGQGSRARFEFSQFCHWFALGPSFAGWLQTGVE